MLYYPFITAVFGTIFGSGYKLATLLRAQRTVVNSANLVISATITGFVGSATGGLSFNRTVITIGCLSGVTLYACVAAFFQVMRYGRLSVQWTVINMAIAVPSAISIIFWGERPSMWTVLGFILTATAMVLMGVDKGKTAHTDDSGEGLNPATDRRGKILWLVLVLIAYFGTGLTQAGNKASVYYGQGDNKLTYLFVMYSVAAILSVVHILVRRPACRWRDIGIGSVMAVSGMICTLYLLAGLQHMDAVIFFPVRSTFAIALTAAVSVFFWRERIEKAGILGLAIAALAICFLSMASA